MSTIYATFVLPGDGEEVHVEDFQAVLAPGARVCLDGVDYRVEEPPVCYVNRSIITGGPTSATMYYELAECDGG